METRNFEIGQAVEVKRRFSQADFDLFAALSGDDNPIHVDPDFAARTKFGRPVAHGMLLYSAVGGVLGSRLPGPGWVQLEQQLKFPTATFVDEEITLRVEITDFTPEAGILALDTRTIRPGGDLGLEGMARVWLPSSQEARWPPLETAGEAAPLPGDATLRNLRLGQSATQLRTFQLDELHQYVALSGDRNPVYSQGQSPLVPAGLLGGLFSALLGTRLPGPGTNYLKQKLHFPAPARAGEAIHATVEIVRIRASKQIVNLRTACTLPSGETVCQGEALVLVSDVQ